MRKEEVGDPESHGSAHFENRRYKEHVDINAHGPEAFIHAVNRQLQQPLHSHAVQVNELALARVALRGQEVFKVFDLVRQLRAQIELRWKLRDPVPGKAEQRDEKKGR